MSLYFTKPWLLLPASVGHKLSPFAIQAHGLFSNYKTYTWSPLTWKGLHFTNRLGVAGGLDKNAKLTDGLWSLGAGFIEVGTVTPLAQKQNPGKVVNRQILEKSLWNALGFPNDGADRIAERLKKIRNPHFTPIFVNIGKNRNTSLEMASNDYVSLIQKFATLADVFVINISSPNTSQLRDLLKPQNLKNFLIPILNTQKKIAPEKPVLLKISPDLSKEELATVIDLSAQENIDGWILTNTTLERTNSFYPSHGGVSGLPLKEKSEQCLKWALEILGNNKKNKLIVSVGGIMSPEDVFKRLDMGADLVQVYSTLIFEGLSFFKKVNASFGEHSKC